ncbi:MAG: DUF2271 domain-containing protein [Planctomycetota bacterium]|nr:DUF2271 domain-containing protein [Planctomycetota bacterium]
MLGVRGVTGIAAVVLTAAGMLAAPKATTAPAGVEEEISREGTALTTTYRLEMRGVSEAQADAAEKAALAEIERLRKVLDTYDATSEIRRMQLSVNKPFACSADLYAVMRACDQWRRATDGAFNADVGEISDLWEKAGKSGQAPAPAALAEAARRAGQTPWRMDAANRTIEPLRKLNLRVGSLGKAYIINSAMAAAKKAAPAAKGMLLAIGGDMTFWTAPDAAEATWEVAVADPRTPADNAPAMGTLALANGAVTSSGGYARFSVVQGKKHSHIINPKTGQSADAVLGTTVVAKDIMLANAMSTTLCVLEPAKGLALATQNGVQCQIFDAAEKVHRTSQWPGTDAPGAAGAVEKADTAGRAGGRSTPGKGAAAAATGWPDGFALNCTVTIKIGGKKPYVAAWVSDAAGNPVKALAVWGTKNKYLKDLWRWSRVDSRFRAEASVVTSATRRAGAYTLTWDGLDADGKPVKPGPYTVNVEMAAEKGGRTDLAVKVECGKTPATGRMEGTIGSCDVKFGPAAK